MSRLIDADELLGKAIKERRFVIAREEFATNQVVIRTVYKDLAEFIACAPAIDAVPVVRCKDCEYYREGKLFPPTKFCFRLRGYDGKPAGYNFSENDFCSRGKRRIDDDKC